MGRFNKSLTLEVTAGNPLSHPPPAREKYHTLPHSVTRKIAGGLVRRGREGKGEYMLALVGEGPCYHGFVSDIP
jgi:hypothetical protein